MPKENPQENLIGAIEAMGWKELNELSDEAQEILHLLAEGPNKEIIKKMVVSIKNKDLVELKRLAYETEIFPYRENIRQALKLLV